MKKHYMDRKAIRARVDLVAHERGLPRSEIIKAKSSESALTDFALRHDLSFDWLFMGDLRALLRMARCAREGW